jgi:hypothetical protein
MITALASSAGLAQADAPLASPSPPVTQEPLNQAWFTGPMLAASGATLPRGHFLIEPYLYDVTQTHANGYGSLTYILYGLTDRLTVGLVPVFGYNSIGKGPSSSGIDVGDTTVEAQYGLTKFRLGSWVPTMGINLGETIPTGRFDQLGARTSDGLGAGAYTTTLSLYMQSYFWTGNGRLLRTRLDLSQAFSNVVNVEGVSVYGTGASFRGTAQPGPSSYADASFEYSLTQRWVPAIDVNYRLNGNTAVMGSRENFNTGSTEVLAVAPAIEYSWNSTVGVLLGTRVVAIAHNAPLTITPAVAINVVL